jgi:hypothetical protein
MTRTLPAALAMGMAQHTTRGVERPFVDMRGRGEKTKCGSGSCVKGGTRQLELDRVVQVDFMSRVVAKGAKMCGTDVTDVAVSKET